MLHYMLFYYAVPHTILLSASVASSLLMIAIHTALLITCLLSVAKNFRYKSFLLFHFYPLTIHTACRCNAVLPTKILLGAVFSNIRQNGTSTIYKVTILLRKQQSK